MKKFLLLLPGLALSFLGIFCTADALAYELGCGNDSQQDHKCAGTCESEDREIDQEAQREADEDNDVGDCDDTGANPINPTKANHHRAVTDITTFGPAPIPFTRNANSRTSDFNDRYWELGHRQVWQHNWNYEVRKLSATKMKVRYPDGNDYNFTSTDGSQFIPAADNGDRLYKWTGSVIGYTLLTPSGKELDFRLIPNTNGVEFQLTQTRNGQGHTWNCTYDSTTKRLTRVTNNFGRWIEIDRETGTDGVLRISQVVTSDGRVVTYHYSAWASSGKYVLSSVTYPGSEAANYTYATSLPTDPNARPLLLTAADPTYRRGAPGAQMKYLWNYTSIAFGNIITGTLLEERSAVTDQTIVSFPLGSGAFPQILQGDGTEITRRYTNGLLTEKGDGEGRMVAFTRGSGGFGFVSAKTDSNGLTQYSRDYAGRVLERIDALTNTRSNTYNAKGFILSKTDEGDHTITWTRDSNSRPTRKDYPDGSHETWTNYNANSQAKTHRMRNGGTETFVYDALGNMTSHTDALHHTTTYAYSSNGQGLMSSMTDARGNTTSYTYNWRGQVLSISRQSLNLNFPPKTFEYDDFGNRTAVIDELGHATRSTYDEYNRLKTVTDPLLRTTEYEFGRAPGCNACSYVNTISRITSHGGKAITYSYDASGLRTCQTVGADTPDAATTFYNYDSRKNLVTMTDPRGKLWHYTYDDKHRKLSATDPLGNTTQWTYDERGNKLTEARPGPPPIGDGPSGTRVTHFVYDERNRLTSATDPAGNITQMTYDEADNLLTLETPNRAYTFGYDPLNRKTTLIYPDGSHEDYGYDDVGNLVTYRARGGQIKTSAYNPLDREVASSWNDALTPSVTKSYDAAGRLLTLINDGSCLSYTYDDANQLTSETQQNMKEAPLSILYSYDADGRRESLVYPSGGGSTYAYTGRGQLSGITHEGGDGILWLEGGPPQAVTYDYDLNGNRLGKALDNGTAAQYTYDDANRLLTVDHKQDGASFARFDYAYDPVGNRTSRTETVGGTTAVSSTDAYGYDAIDQVNAVKYNFKANTNTQDRLVDYNYDALGNRTSVVDGGTPTNYSANNLNQYTAVGNLAPLYDGNGNLSVHDGWTYAYDAQNRLVSATSSGGYAVSFAYDGRNRCISRTVNDETSNYYYDGWNLIEEHIPGNKVVTRYVHGAQTDELLRRTDADGSVYYHHDALGSTVALSDGGGNPIERYSYDVYGAPTFRDGDGNPTSTSTNGNRFLFTGREYLPELGLYDYRNRMYSAQLGRFLQTDPIRFSAGDGNLYRYVHNRVSSHRDPAGRQEDLPPNPFDGDEDFDLQLYPRTDFHHPTRRLLLVRQTPSLRIQISGLEYTSVRSSQGPVATGIAREATRIVCMESVQIDRLTRNLRAANAPLLLLSS